VRAIREEGVTTGPGVLGTYTYDNLGQRRRLARGNGVVTTYTPDAGSRLVAQADDLAGSAKDQVVALGYNPVGQLKRRTSANDAYAFPDYIPTQQSVAPNALNQMLTLNGASPRYDLNGNLTSDARGNSYTYNHDNQLVQKIGGATLAYDTAGRLLTIAGGGGGAVRFDHDPVGLGIVAESTPGGALMRRYVHGPAVDEPLVWYEGPGATDRRWYSADERGSVTAITREDGSTVAINAYDENGVPAKRNIGRFGYTGQAWLPELGPSTGSGQGLYYYKARMYDPALGRFLQTDPIGYVGGVNLYAYVRGDPVNFVDPLGLHCEGNGLRETLNRADCEAAGGTYTPDVRVVGNFDSGGGGASGLGFGLSPVGNNAAVPPAVEGAEVVVIAGCDDVCRANLQEQERIKWVLYGSQFRLNPYYVDPAPWLNLENTIAAGPIGGAIVALFTPTSASILFGRGGIANSNRFFRIGWGPGRDATRTKFYETFRISIGRPYQPGHRHWDLPGTRRVP
jgi:RHS repeat-associated protein